MENCLSQAALFLYFSSCQQKFLSVALASPRKRKWTAPCQNTLWLGDKLSCLLHRITCINLCLEQSLASKGGGVKVWVAQYDIICYESIVCGTPLRHSPYIVACVPSKSDVLQKKRHDWRPRWWSSLFGLDEAEQQTMAIEVCDDTPAAMVVSTGKKNNN